MTYFNAILKEHKDKTKKYTTKCINIPKYIVEENNLNVNDEIRVDISKVSRYRCLDCHTISDYEVECPECGSKNIVRYK